MLNGRNPEVCLYLQRERRSDSGYFLKGGIGLSMLLLLYSYFLFKVKRENWPNYILKKTNTLLLRLIEISLHICHKH